LLILLKLGHVIDVDLAFHKVGFRPYMFLSKIALFSKDVLDIFTIDKPLFE